jgi:hypothetical protein
MSTPAFEGAAESGCALVSDLPTGRLHRVTPSLQKIGSPPHPKLGQVLGGAAAMLFPH